MRALSLACCALALVACDAARAPTTPSVEPLAPPSAAERAALVLADVGDAHGDGLSRATPLVDASGHALDAFRAALERAARGEGHARLAFYGGSHTASDLYTGFIRTRLQRRFGDSGHGFVVAAPPITDFWQWGARVEEAEGWAAYQPSSKRTEVDPYGLVGMAFESEGEASASVRTERTRADRIELMFLRQPGGGTLELRVDDAEAQRIDTSAQEASAGHLVIGVADGEHRVSLRALGDGPVRLFGVVFEREAAGVVVDQLGLVGSKARHHLLWTRDVWAALFRTRRPDLVAFSYGNNEANDTHLSFEEHRVHFAEMLGRVRREMPEASCVVIGPSERMVQGPGGVWKVPSGTALLNEGQRDVSAQQGCAFFDTLAWQGGAGAVERWLDADPPLMRADRVHFTDTGYHRLGAALLRALLSGMAPAERR